MDVGFFLSEVVMEKEINAGYEIIDRQKAGSTWINVNKVDRKKRKNHVIINNASF